MYIILVYDINEKRVGKTLKVCRRYLNWVQNSVFEGELTASKLQALKLDLKKIIKKEEDSVLIYRFREEKSMKKETMGKEKSVSKVDDAGHDELSFEDALAKLELAVRDLEEGGLSLEQAFNRFEEGIRISRLCTTQLERAKMRIERL